MRKVLAFVALVAVVAVGRYAVVGGSGDDSWTVGGVAEDPAAVADACRDLVPEGVGYALSSGPGLAAGENLYSTVAGQDAASRVADCLREQGATSVEIAPAAPVKSFAPTGP